MENKLDQLIKCKSKRLLNIYCTAGYPFLHSTADVIFALQSNGADMVEIGMPYSDPVADGPVIQQSNAIALNNGMTMELLFDQLSSIKDKVTIPVILMGYINPVLQFGMEQFCKRAFEAGVSAVILPDLPQYEFRKYYQEIFKKYQLGFIFLISPTSSAGSIKQADKLSNGFLYAVSAAGTTGGDKASLMNEEYFKYLGSLKLKNKLMIGFGIKDNPGFEKVCTYAAGGIIGTAYIKHIANQPDISAATHTFISAIRGI